MSDLGAPAFEITDEPSLGAGTDLSPDPLACPDCEFRGSTERGLKRHRTIKHGAGGDREPKGNAAARAKRFEKLQADLEASMVLISAGLTMSGNARLSIDGGIVATNASAVASAWTKLAESNRGVEKVLMSITGGVAYGEVITATAMMVLAILANHGVLPEQILYSMAPVVVQAAQQNGQGYPQ